jgi:hypothetical protein
VTLKTHDEKFATVFAAIKQLIAPPTPAKKRIGFHPGRRPLCSVLCFSFPLSAFQLSEASVSSV